MMDLKSLMKTKPETLAQIQHDELKKYILETLKTVTELVKKEDFNGIGGILTYSPAGDGYGTDHRFIDFDYDGHEKDLQEIMEELKYLKDLMNMKKEE